MSLGTPNTVETLQTSLQAKAKTEPAYRFYSLWDKVCREDVLEEAYRRCCANAGASGVDGETFDRIDAHGINRWLGKLRKELVAGSYAPQPLLRVWIPKSNGGQRPLGIPTIRDRVVQMAVVLVVGPIFEADLLPQQYGFRPGLDAKMAVRRVFWHVTQHWRQEVVDADLRDYFTSIPHAPLMRCLERRITDGRVLKTIKRWLTAPVVENISGRRIQTAEARRKKRGTPQGGVISPLLANLYFRRFLLAWQLHGHQEQLAPLCCAQHNGAYVAPEVMLRRTETVACLPGGTLFERNITFVRYLADQLQRREIHHVRADTIHAFPYRPPQQGAVCRRA